MARLALAVGEEAELGFDRATLFVDRRAVAAAFRQLGQVVLLYRRQGDTLVFIGSGRVAGLDAPLGSLYCCRIEAFAGFDLPVDGAQEARMPGVRRMLGLTDERFAELIEAGRRPAPELAAEEAATGFLGRRPMDGYLEVRAEVLKRWNYRCAVTDTQFAPGEAPELRLVAIRPRDRGGPLHAANYLPMVELAEYAWRTGAISVTETGAFVAVMDRLPPELLEAMPPGNQLIVPDDPALRPDPAHLSWHRVNVFGR